MSAVLELPRANETRVRRRTSGARLLKILAAVACWTALLVTVLVTTILIEWTLLGLVLVGQVNPGSSPMIPAVLLALNVGLAVLTARAVASARAVAIAIVVVIGLVTIVGVTWARSAPDQALFFARTTAYGESSPHDVERFSQRVIANGTTSYHFAQNPSPQLFQTIQYSKGGDLKQTSVTEFLDATDTTSFIVIKDGAILDETYANGYARDSIVTSFSVAKSFTSALIGIAINEGYIGGVNDPIVMYLPELRGRGLDGVTIRDLLVMSSGTAFTHQAAQPPPLNGLPFNDDSLTTYYPDIRSLVLSVHPGADRPGTVFEYNKMVPGLLGVILERTTHRSVSEYLQEKIWQPLEMEYPASWSLDSTYSGFERMESGLNARAIDFARFGQLYLDDGSWNGTQIVPAAWVRESTTPDPNDQRPWLTMQPWKNASGYYKYLWWGRTRADSTYTYMAWGDRGQFIFVSPTDRVVIVRYGLTDGGVDSWADVFQFITERVSTQVPAE
jgi:CubicO group peptidase (beta-lactamase class C family)